MHRDQHPGAQSRHLHYFPELILYSHCHRLLLFPKTGLGHCRRLGGHLFPPLHFFYERSGYDLGCLNQGAPLYPHSGGHHVFVDGPLQGGSGPGGGAGEVPDRGRLHLRLGILDRSATEHPLYLSVL